MKHLMRHRWNWTWVVFVIVMLGICWVLLSPCVLPKISKPARPSPVEVEPVVETEDANNDMQSDGFFYKREGALFRINHDRNFDGRLDEWVDVDGGRWIHRKADDNYNRSVDVEEDFSGQGLILTRRRDLDHDNQMDFTEFFDDEGRLLRAEHDTNKDGKPDVWKFFSNTIISRRETDVNFDGKADRFETYDAKGTLLEESIDTNFDGVVDIKK